MVQKRKALTSFVALLAVLLCIGFAALASASWPMGFERFGDGYHFLKHQVLFGLIPGIIGWKLGPLVHTAITNGVRSVAHRFDPPTEPPTPLTQETPSALPHIRRAIRAHKMLAGGELNPSELFEGD
jgi:hypothetical protein